MDKRDQIPYQSASVAVADGAVPVVLRRAGVSSGAALVIAPSAFGIGEDLLGQMEVLAQSAALVVAMDVFWRDQPGPVPYSDFPRVMARLRALDRARAYTDFRAVVQWARTQPGCDNRVIGLGICFGGPFCFLAAAEGLLQGLATWHGTHLEAFLERAKDMRCPMALHFGDRDRVVPMAATEQIRAAFAGREDVKIVVHAGADHGFSHPTAPTWDAEATAAGMSSVRRLLVEAR